jgi:GNAT superfamily N-acetyltransferase
MKPLHHPLFSLMFRDYSYALYKNEEIASYIYGAGNSNKVFIHVIATKPKFYNQGMAGLLLEKIEKKARLGKKLSIWCYIVPGNILSENFFKSRGFIMRKQIKINSDEIRILYRKKLT